VLVRKNYNFDMPEKSLHNSEPEFLSHEL